MVKYGRPVEVADVVDLHDVDVPQARGGLGLAPEALPFVRSGKVAGQQHLHGDRAVEPLIPRPVNDTHAAPAQLVLHFVAAEMRRLGGPRPEGRRAGAGRRTRGARRRAWPRAGADTAARARTSASNSGSPWHTSSGLLPESRISSSRCRTRDRRSSRGSPSAVVSWTPTGFVPGSAPGQTTRAPLPPSRSASPSPILYPGVAGGHRRRYTQQRTATKLKRGGWTSTPVGATSNLP